MRCSARQNRKPEVLACRHVVPSVSSRPTNQVINTELNAPPRLSEEKSALTFMCYFLQKAHSTEQTQFTRVFQTDTYVTAELTEAMRMKQCNAVSCSMRCLAQGHNMLMKQCTAVSCSMRCLAQCGVLLNAVSCSMRCLALCGVLLNAVSCSMRCLAQCGVLLNAVSCSRTQHADAARVIKWKCVI